MDAHRLTIGCACALACLLAGCGATTRDKAGGAATGDAGTTLKFHGDGPGGYFPIEARKRPPGEAWAGFVKTDTLFDPAGAKAGLQDSLCFAGAIKRRSICRVTVDLKDASIVAEGTISGGGFGTGGMLAVTGGTGRYEGARGTYKTTSAGPRGTTIIIHLLSR